MPKILNFIIILNIVLISLNNGQIINDEMNGNQWIKSFQKFYIIPPYKTKRQKNISNDKIVSNTSPSGSDINTIEQNDIPDFKKFKKAIKKFNYSHDCRYRKHVFSL